MQVAALNIHPVKSLRAVPVESLAVDPLGAVGDRRFLIVDAGGNFVTQRSVAQMARVDASIDHSLLTLRTAGAADLRVSRAPDPAAPLLSVRVWKSEGLLAEDCGEAPASWISRVLGAEFRLVRIGPAFSRPVKPGPGLPGDLVGFADGYPFLVVSEESVADLNRRIAQAGGSPVPMDRFRANLVVSGCKPFAEDLWTKVRIGSLVFRAAGPCKRCIITTTDQTTGERGREPLRTLATFRRDSDDPSQVIFGQNLVHETKEGVLRVGDRVEILR